MLKRLHELGKLIVACETYIMHNGKVLMHKRAKNKAKFPGFWIGPGGHIEEGETKWIDLDEVLKLKKLFPPFAYYLKHILDKKSGILYNSSEWKDALLVKVLSERVDQNG